MKKKMACIITTILVLICQISVYAKTYEYDDLNRVIKVIYDDGSYATYEYDKNGNIIKINVYDNDGNKTEETTTDRAEQETTHKSEPETTHRSEPETTHKKEPETTHINGEKTTSGKQNIITGNNGNKTINHTEEPGRQITTIRNNTSDVSLPFGEVNSYILNLNKTKEQSSNNNYNIKSDDKNNNNKNNHNERNKYNINNKGKTDSGISSAMGKEESVRRLSIKIQNIIKKLAYKTCRWLFVWAQMSGNR